MNENQETTTSDIQAGERVIKDKGDYVFEGEVLAVMRKKSGAIRYAVENDAGMIHIFSRGQISKVEEKGGAA